MPRRKRIRRQPSIDLIALAFGLATVGLLAGCSSSATSATATTGRPGSTASLPTGRGGLGAAQGLAKLESSLSGDNARTYKATYALVAPSLSGTLVIERMPPSSSRFEMAVSGKQVAVISTSAATYVCDLATSPGT